MWFRTPGCGDGRIVIAARKCSAQGVGVDIEPYWVAESQANAKRSGVEHLVAFNLQDATSADLSPALQFAGALQIKSKRRIDGGRSKTFDDGRTRSWLG